MPPASKPLAERFWSKVEKTDSCWIWTAATVGQGYGYFWHSEGRMERAHRMAWMLERGEIPEGLELDHLCRNKLCVNPDHLEPVTPRVNQHRSDSVSGINARKTHCPSGHPFDDENTYLHRGKRYCKTCVRDRSREWQRKKRARHAA